MILEKKGMGENRLLLVLVLNLVPLWSNVCTNQQSATKRKEGRGGGGLVGIVQWLEHLLPTNVANSDSMWAGGLSLLLVLFSFSLGTQVFSSPQKSAFSNPYSSCKVSSVTLFAIVFSLVMKF